MKIVKMFDWYEDIVPYLDEKLLDEYDLEDLEECPTNDTAIRYLVEKSEYNTDFETTLAEYFLSQGCKEDEHVYIWISW